MHAPLRAVPPRLPAHAVFLTALALLLAAEPALAIPAFARRHGTSCQTCHIAYPKLNPFGEAYRLLGYRMPSETEAQVKQPDVPLGAPGQKKVFPRAVWPGAIPPNVPLALVAEFLVERSSALEGGEQEEVKFDFVFPTEVALIAGGTAGDHVAYFGEIAFEQEAEDGQIHSELAVEHIDVRFTRIIKDSLALNAKIGSFQPELVSNFDHARRLTVANYDSMFGVQPVGLGGAGMVGGGGHGGGAGLALPAISRGIELYGVAGHRVLWSAGVVNGLEAGHETFDANPAKDVYARVAYKLGGLAPDGSNADTYSTSEKNWRENSFRLGGFVYRGDGGDVYFGAGAGDAHAEEEADEHGEEEGVAFLEDATFTRLGVDFNWFYKDLNVFGAYVRGRDELRAFAAQHDDPDAPGELEDHESGEFTYHAFFLEADVVLGYPWLHGAARYERVNLPLEGAGDYERAVVSLTGLIRANVKATAEYALDLNESKNYAAWLNVGLAF